MGKCWSKFSDMIVIHFLSILGILSCRLLSIWFCHPNLNTKVLCSIVELYFWVVASGMHSDQLMYVLLSQTDFTVQVFNLAKVFCLAELAGNSHREWAVPLRLITLCRLVIDLEASLAAWQCPWVTFLIQNVKLRVKLNVVQYYLPLSPRALVQGTLKIISILFSTLYWVALEALQ